MAEALGFAASVIAVVDMTTKVGSASFKLMRLWSEVKEVPVMLREKAERIKDLEDFLDDAEIQMANNQLPKAVYNMARLQKHIAKARCALTDVQEMVDQLQGKANAGQRGFKQRFASTKVLLRKDEWNALDKSLDSALYLLSIAQAQCVMAMTTACTAVLLEEQPRPSRIPGQSLIGNGHSFKTDGEKENSIERRKPNYAHSTLINVFHMPYSNSFLPTFRFGFGANSSFQFSVLTPTWLSGSVYSILAQRSFQGWQLNLRAYEVMEDFPEDLVGSLKQDDYLGFFRCLDENKITLHARNQHDQSLLEFAMIYGGFTTTKLLLERGLDRSISDRLSPTVNTPRLFVPIVLLSSYESGPQDLQFLELCAAYGLDDVLDPTETSGLLLEFGVSFPAFQAYLKRNDFAYYLLPIETRLQHLRGLAEDEGYWSLDEIKQIIPKAEELTAEIIEISVKEECALLHSFILLFLRRLVTWVNHPGGEQRLEEKQWAQLIGSCIRQDPTSLHRLESILAPDYERNEFSPFPMLWCLFGKEIYSYRSRNPWPPGKRLATALDLVLTTWITTLSDCGVDLLYYGRQERQLYNKGSTRYRQRFILWDLQQRPQVSLIGFTYGSRPEQWRLWWAVDYEDYAGEFWDLVESRDFKMPGSWVDEPWGYDGYFREEESRLEMWEREEPTPLIWSEYRKIRPPI